MNSNEKSFEQIVDEELGHKVRQMLGEVQAGFAMSAFNYASEIEILTGVRRDDVHIMATEVAQIIRHEGW